MIYCSSNFYKQFEKSGFLNRMNPLKRLSIIFKNAPVQIKILAGAGILYMPINFFMSSGLGSDGLMIKEFSGHWMAFYGIAAAAMYPFQRAVVL